MNYLKKATDGLGILLDDLKVLGLRAIKALVIVIGALACVEVLVGIKTNIVLRTKSLLGAVGISEGLLTGAVIAIIIIMLYNKKPPAA